MKLGLALSGRMITRDNLRFARQAGVTHVVLHLTDYGKDRRQAACPRQGRSRLHRFAAGVDL